MALVLRVALDDNSQLVITWAAEALAQLVASESIGPGRTCSTPSGSKDIVSLCTNGEDDAECLFTCTKDLLRTHYRNATFEPEGRNLA